MFVHFFVCLICILVILFPPLWLVISSKEWQENIIHDVQVGLGNNLKAKALASHHGRDATQQKTLKKFFCHNI